MIQDIDSELRRLEQEAANLEKQKADLLRKQQQQEEQLKKLDNILEQSGYSSAKQLIEDLMVRFKISPSQLNKRSSSIEGGRTRTTVNADLRDAISADLAAGMSKSAVGRKHGVSYMVVRGVETGKYQNL